MKTTNDHGFSKPAVEDGTLIRDIVRDEIAGKNSAVHAYDRMLWAVRTGFLTLLFAGWGLLLTSLTKAVADKTTTEILDHSWPFIMALLAVSVALAVSGFAVDRNYVRRKFRVIAALNQLMGVLTSYDENTIFEMNFLKQHIQPLLTVSGDSGSDEYKDVGGYKPALWVSIVIYTIPLVGVIGGLYVLSLHANT